ncbi:MAG: hypothetical protein DI617_08575 [Streptococcus pyogenes]|nr:MAG: hypothetical protein DI617_08575 [Streptococcus pyogenes]
MSYSVAIFLSYGEPFCVGVAAGGEAPDGMQPKQGSNRWQWCDRDCDNLVRNVGACHSYRPDFRSVGSGGAPRGVAGWPLLCCSLQSLSLTFLANLVIPVLWRMSTPSFGSLLVIGQTNTLFWV